MLELPNIQSSRELKNYLPSSHLEISCIKKIAEVLENSHNESCFFQLPAEILFKILKLEESFKLLSCSKKLACLANTVAVKEFFKARQHETRFAFAYAKDPSHAIYFGRKPDDEFYSRFSCSNREAMVYFSKQNVVRKVCSYWENLAPGDRLLPVMYKGDFEHNFFPHELIVYVDSKDSNVISKIKVYLLSKWTTSDSIDPANKIFSINCASDSRSIFEVKKEIENMGKSEGTKLIVGLNSSISVHMF